MNTKRLVIAGIIAALSTGAVWADWYVATNGAGVGTNGWADATNNLQGAVAKCPNNSTVWLSNGTFSITGEISVTTPITIKGYFGRDASIVNGNYPTVTNRCFTLSHAGAILDSLTISNGRNEAAFTTAGAVDMSVGGTITNCVITDCRSTAVGTWGAIYMGDGAAGKIANCVIKNNSGASYAGAIRVGSGSLSYVRNCEIYNNTGYNGGAILIYGGTIENCIVSGNHCGQQGAILASSGAATIRNCLIAGNDMSVSGGTKYGAGICINSNGVRMINCTIVSNYADSSYGGIYYQGADTSVGVDYFVNCIIASNRYSSGYSDIGLVSSSLTNSFVACCSPVDALPASRGNLKADPKFVDAPGNNWRLQRYSPCIDAGSNQTWMANAKDLDGRQRIDPLRRQVDMGAYEFLHKGTMLEVK